LLGTLLSGLIIPIIPLNVMAWFPEQPTTTTVYIEPIIESVQRVDTVIAVQTAKEEVSYGLIFFWMIYAIGVVVCLWRFGKGLWKIYQLYGTSEIHQKGNYKLVLTNQPHLPFSFFNYLFWSKDTQVEDKDAGTIITHEVAHINQWHSIDTLFLEWLGIFLWFSPPIYWYKKSLRDIHEYLADACVLKDTKTKQYGHLLLKQAQSGMQLALASHFLDSQLKKRILMMTKNQSSNQALMKYLSALPLLVLMVMVFSNPQVRANLNATAQLSIDYLNPEVKVPPISPSLLFWIGGDFDREKAKKVLEEAYKSEGSFIGHPTILSTGEERTYFTTGDQIKELHQAAIFLIRKYPAHKKEIHELAIAVGKDNGYALRFHENGESIIYRELEEKALKHSKNVLIVLNDEVFGVLPKGLQELSKKDIQTTIVVPAPTAIEQYGEQGKNGALKIYSDKWHITELAGRKILKLKHTPPPILDNHLVLFNDTIVGFHPEAIAHLGGFSAPDVIHSIPKIAIEKYGEELGKNGAMNYISDEFTVINKGGKKVVVRKADLVDPQSLPEHILAILNDDTIAERRYRAGLKKNDKKLAAHSILPTNNLVIVNGIILNKEQADPNSIPSKWIAKREELTKEDLFMRGMRLNGEMPDKGVAITLKEDFTIVKDAWGEVTIFSKSENLSSLYTDDRKVFLQVDQMPILASCAGETTVSEQRNCSRKTFLHYIYRNIRYPDAARRAGIAGTGSVQFTIEKDGTLSNPFITKSIEGIDEEMIRVFNKMKSDGIRWIPGHQNGEDVRVVMNTPFEFRLEGLDEEPPFKTTLPTEKGRIVVTGLRVDDALPTSDQLQPSFDKISKAIEEHKKALKQQLQELQINISPNPAQEDITLTIIGEAKPVFIQVTDMVGRQLYKQKIEDFSGQSVETILFEEAVKGMVIVTVSQGMHTIQKKVVVR